MPTLPETEKAAKADAVIVKEAQRIASAMLRGRGDLAEIRTNRLLRQGVNAEALGQAVAVAKPTKIRGVGYEEPSSKMIMAPSARLRENIGVLQNRVDTSTSGSEAGAPPPDGDYAKVASGGVEYWEPIEDCSE